MTEQLRKALGTGNPGGHGLLQTLVAHEIIPLIRQRSYMRQFLREITMPSPTYNVPKMLSVAGVYGVAEGGTPAEASMDVGEIVLVAKKLMFKLPLNAELSEDAVVPIIPVIKDEIVREFATAEEKVWLNGDVTIGAGNISGALAAGDPRLQVSGLRKNAGVSVDAGNDIFTLDVFNEALYALDVYGDIKEDLLMVIPRCAEAHVRKLQGFMDIQAKAGAQSTMLTGEIGKIYGVPVVATSLLPENLNANGVYDNATTDRSCALLIHRNAYIIGDRRKFQIRTSDEIRMDYDQILLVASERIAGQVVYAPSICLIKNIKKAIN